MNDYKTKSVCVYDQGLFAGMALRLAEFFGKVYYYSPWQNPFPSSNPRLIGYGFDNIERTNHFFDIVDDVDLFVFPDVFDGDLQCHLDRLGKRVWGSRKGEELELYRPESKIAMENMGIAIGNYIVIRGLPQLRTYLKGHDNQWVKLSVTRGDFHTFHAKNYKIVEPRLDELEWKLGAKKYIMEFIVESSIDNAVEIGSDLYCIDGVYPNAGVCGIEIKDAAYLAAFKDYKDMPSQVTGVNDKLAPALQAYKYRNFISTEIRVTEDGTPYMLDLAARAGSPPSELFMNMFENFADIIWQGAGGVCIDPIPVAKFGVELMIHSEWAGDTNWQAVHFPDKLKDKITLKNFARINGNHYVVPQNYPLPEIGSVIAMGNSLEEAIETIKEYAELIESYDLVLHPEALDEAQNEIDKLTAWGIKLI